jgi:membrane-associated protein
VAYVSIGSAAAGTYRQLADQLHWAGYVFVAIIAGFLIIAYIVKRLLKRAEERHMKQSDESDATSLDGH